MTLSYQDYRAYRLANPRVSAIEAKRILAIPKPDPIPWKKVDGRDGILARASLKIDSFRVTVRVFLDTGYDSTDCRGKFDNEWSPGAIQNPEWYRNRWTCYRWFHPENTLAYHRRELREMHYGRSEAYDLARSYVLHDMKLAASLEEAGYMAVGVEAEVYLEGLKLADDSIWGTEIESVDDPYVTDLAWEVVESAVSAAHTTMECLLPHFEKLLAERTNNDAQP